MRKFTFWLSALFLVFGLNVATAQTKVISGKVTDASGPLPGVSVVVKGTTKGTQTDFDGKYSLSANVGDVLVFSYVGMEPTSKTVGAANVIDVKMAEGAVALQEVVVVAYGTTTKEALTGAVAQIKSDQLERRPVTNVSTALEGSTAGVMVTAPSGQPGSGQSIRIRGFGSFGASNDPLYVVDGIPINGNLSAINPNDIENISILKDASSTALFGNKATNGVVMVTTKKGKTTKGQLNFTASTGIVSRGTPEYDRIDAFDYYPIMWESLRNSTAIPGTATDAQLAAASLSASNTIFNQLGYNPFNVPNNQIVGTDGKLNPNANLLWADDLDWVDAITRVGFRRNYDFSYQGKSENADYYASVGYLNEKGYVINSDFSRVSTRLNLNYQAKSWLKTGLKLSGTISEGNLAPTGNSNSFVNPFRFTRQMGPIYPIHAHDRVTGAYILDDNGNRKFDLADTRTSNSSTGRHIVAELLYNTDVDEINNFNAKTYATINLAEGLSFTTNLSYEEANFYNTLYWNKIIGDGAPSGLGSKTFQRTSTIGFNQLLNYNKSFGDHNFDLLAGHESQELKIDALTGTRREQIVDGNTELINFVTTTDLSSVQDMNTDDSYFGRFNYNYGYKYFLSSSIRTDGSSRFAEDQRWGTFWSLGGSWSADKEEFIANIPWINQLKLRASYGELGNNRGIGFYPWQATFALDNNNQTASGFIRSGLGAPNLKWETSANFDVAIEFGLFDRLSATVEYYNKESENLIFDVPVALSDGADNRKENIGTLFNRGIELSLAYDIFKKQDFKWNIAINAFTLKNEFTKLPQEEIINGTKKLMVGKSLYDYWIRDWYGVDPADGAGLFVANDPAAAGVRNINGVDVTPFQNNAKFHYAGSVIPDLMGSVSNSLSYKNFSLDFMFTYQIGGDNLDLNYASIMDSGAYGASKGVDILNRWQKPGDITEVPRMDAVQASNWNVTSDRWLTDASFLSLRQINFAYTFPQLVVNNIGLTNAQIFASAENLFSINARKGFNVQQEFSGNTSNVYTPSQVVSVGLNLKF